MRVLYFAHAADAAGCREEDWDTPAPMTLETFWEEALRRHPDLAPITRQCRVASGMEYVGEGETIDPSLETAVIPPVSGG